MTEKILQCRACPWRVGCDLGEIPNYDAELHEDLTSTIASPGELNLDILRIMACHNSKPGREFACAGWLNHQLGAGNNVGLRIAVASRRMPVPVVDGPQHKRFEDTLCAEVVR